MELERLAGEHRRLIFGIALRIVGSLCAAEEVYQETLFRIWQGLPRFSKRCPLAAWIAVIARNTSISHVRREARQRCVSLADVSGTAAPVHDPIVQLEMDQLVRRLPEGQRVVVELFYFQRCPVKDIAALLQIPNATVRGRLHSARRALARGSTAISPPGRLSNWPNSPPTPPARPRAARGWD